MMGNDKERSTVILAALLHDIGKLYQRISSYAERIYHGEHSRNFVGRFLENVWQNIDEYVDVEMLKDLVYYHHSDRIRNEARGVSDNLKNLMWLISEADNLSAKEREQKEGQTLSPDEREYHLYSVFSRIGEKKINDEEKPYQNSVLAPDIGLDNAAPLGRAIRDYRLTDLAPRKFTFWQGYNFVYNILLKFGSLIPDFTLGDYPDTSLFVHSSLCSAFAACLYDYHKANNGISKDNVEKKDFPKFIVYKGGLSPVQNFLFEIERENPKYGAKVLRGKSALMTLLSTAIAYSILYKLDLPVANCIVSAGTHFTLLLPNTDNARNVISEVEKRTHGFLLENLLSKVNYVSHYRIVSAKDILESYPDVFDKIGKGFNEAKYRPYYDREEMDEVSVRLYEVYAQEVGASNQAGVENKPEFCEFCGVYWVEPESNQNISDDKGPKYCYICNRAKEMGEKLPKNNIISFVPVDDANVDNDSSRITIAFMKIDINKNLPSPNAYVSYYDFHTEKVNVEKEREFIQTAAIYHPISAYLPEFEHFPDICNRCKSVDSCNVKETKGEHRFLTFQCIANADKEVIDDKFVGDDLLAVLKADVDNLGKLVKSFKEKELGDESGRSAMTISRFYQFSFFLDYFFSGVLPYRLQEEYPHLYLVYAGGDDLLLIGPWRSVVYFAKDVRKWFARYVFDNPEITLSAGISFFKPKTPLKWAVGQADEALKRAKEEGKNRLTIKVNDNDGIFVFKWDEVVENWFIERIENILVDSIKTGIWGRSKLNRLLDLWRMAKGTLDNRENIENYLYASYFRYMMSRDFPDIRKLKGEEKEIVEKIEKDIGRYFSSSPPRGTEMELRNLGLAIYMALIGTRR